MLPPGNRSTNVISPVFLRTATLVLTLQSVETPMPSTLLSVSQFATQRNSRRGMEMKNPVELLDDFSKFAVAVGRRAK